MLDQVQIIKDQDEARFAVIPYEDYLFLRDLLNDQEKLEDYLDYLHVQQVKAESSVRYSLEEVKRMLGLIGNPFAPDDINADENSA
ncbi:MAG: prevent-host-death family protein [Candidatus Promineofilum sp.]|jgi:hypothetical protein|nr:prevent-host-death family protein [Promineifilum sp.]